MTHLRGLSVFDVVSCRQNPGNQLHGSLSLKVPIVRFTDVGIGTVILQFLQCPENFLKIEVAGPACGAIGFTQMEVRKILAATRRTASSLTCDSGLAKQTRYRE